jgi:hypothetical protein
MGPIQSQIAKVVPYFSHHLRAGIETNSGDRVVVSREIRLRGQMLFHNT